MNRLCRASLLLFVPLLFAAGCQEKATAPLPANAPRGVKTLEIGAVDFASQNVYSGEVRARHEIPLAFRVGGKLVERTVDVGDRIRAGQVLARLESSDLALTLRQAEATREQALAEARRAQELRRKGFISEAALEAKVTFAETASAQAQLARNQLAYAELSADASGVVSAVLAEAGQIVAAGQPVLRIARDGEREAAITVPESQVGRLRPGVSAEVRLWNGRRYRGVLRSLAPMAEAATRTYAARVTLLDADEDARLGMSAQVVFAEAEPAVIVVPLSALIQQGDRPAVWVVGEDERVRLRSIEVARYTDRGAIVASGLHKGETIVAAGAFLLSEGERVRILR
ncbi:MAG: efflux RND transporter periplasmic adaptor subunit [Rhodocyclaceae bacterium]|nr:efflux RND transporter periplasmic adaptor subunit [Rhodocyclaceae bacterium]